MENIEVYETETYQKGEITPSNWKTNLQYIRLNIYLVLKVTSLMIAEPFIALWYLFTKKSSSSQSIEGQIALVTGGANGLGRAISFRLAKEKCLIAIADINFTAAQQTAKEIHEKYGVETKAYKVDVSEVESVNKLKNDIETGFGPVDILINNAGIMPLSSLREETNKNMQKIIDVNFTSHIWTVRAFLDGMIERKRGKIVAIASLSAKLSLPMSTIYSTTKAAVKAFMDSLYEELCCYNQETMIRLTTVFPGFIATRKELTDMLKKSPSLMSNLTPEEVADEVVNGMLNYKKDITIPRIFNIFAWCSNNILLPRTYKFTKTKLFQVKALESVQKQMRQKNKMN